MAVMAHLALCNNISVAEARPITLGSCSVISLGNYYNYIKLLHSQLSSCRLCYVSLCLCQSSNHGSYSNRQSSVVVVTSAKKLYAKLPHFMHNISAVCLNTFLCLVATTLISIFITR